MKTLGTALVLDGDNLRIQNQNHNWFWKLTPEIFENAIKDKWDDNIISRELILNLDGTEAQKQALMFGDAGWTITHTPKLTIEGKTAADGFLFLSIMGAVNDPSVRNIVIGSGDHDLLPVMKHVTARKNLLVVTPIAPSVTIARATNAVSLHDIYEQRIIKGPALTGPFMEVFNNTFPKG